MNTCHNKDAMNVQISVVTRCIKDFSRQIDLSVAVMFTDAPRLPDTLEDAMKELEKDKVMVEALGSEFVEWYVKFGMFVCSAAANLML